MSPLHSRGPQKVGTKSEVAASPLPSPGPTSGQNCYITPAFSGVPRKGQNQKWVHWGQGQKFGCAAQKNITQKNSHRNDVPMSKNTLKTPPRIILKKRRGGVQNPPRYRISEPPPPPMKTPNQSHFIIDKAQHCCSIDYTFCVITTNVPGPRSCSMHAQFSACVCEQKKCWTRCDDPISKVCYKPVTSMFPGYLCKFGLRIGKKSNNSADLRASGLCHSPPPLLQR